MVWWVFQIGHLFTVQNYQTHPLCWDDKAEKLIKEDMVLYMFGQEIKFNQDLILRNQVKALLRNMFYSDEWSHRFQNR